MKQLPPPLMVEIHCNHREYGKACGKTWAQLIAGRYFCVSCKRRIRNVVWR